MGYDDRFYYGQGKLRVKSDAANNGKAVSVYSGNRYYTNTLVDGVADFTVAPTKLYSISLDDTYKTDVSMGYGDVKTVEI